MHMASIDGLKCVENEITIFEDGYENQSAQFDV